METFDFPKNASSYVNNLLILYEEKGIVVHEVNNTVEFKGLSKVAKRYNKYVWFIFE